MGDILVRLYDLAPFDTAGVDPAGSEAAGGVSVRRVFSGERGLLLDFVGTHFFPAWVGECAVAMGGHPLPVWVAVAGGRIVGFACHDATTRGFFGPTGVEEGFRGRGIGKALLLATLGGMREAGYAYAVIGDPGPMGFYLDNLPAMEIPGSKPGFYRGMLR